MLNLMPVEYVASYDTINWDINSMFGFFEAIITTPKNINIPLLPFKQDNQTIHRRGTWQAIYFTEELKEVINMIIKLDL